MNFFSEPILLGNKKWAGSGMKSTIERLRTGWKLYRYGIFSILFNKAMMGYIRLRTFILYSFDLKKEPASFPLQDPSICIKRIENGHDELFRRFHRIFPAKEFITRIENRQVCYLALQEDEVVAYAWVAPDDLFIDDINRRFILGENEIFIHSCFVQKASRGYGIYPGMLRRILHDYHRLSFRQAFIGVISENSGSARGIKKAGFKGCTNIRYFKLLNYENWRVEEHYRQQ
ncbi:MAG: GNAT family N-acetyltransferase [Balneolaceae bacterium]